MTSRSVWMWLVVTLLVASGFGYWTLVSGGASDPEAAGAAANEKLSFSDLKSLLNTTDGNISVHARKLEDAGYLTMKKSFSGRTPLTEYKITREGRKALEKYLDHMEALINAMKGK